MFYASHSYGKGKSKYSLWGNLLYCLKTMWEWNKLAVFAVTLSAIPIVLAEYATTLLPAVVVRDLEDKNSLPVLFLHIIVLCLIMWIGNLLNNTSGAWMRRSMPSFLQHVKKKFTAKIMDLDFDLLEDEKSRETIGNVTAALRHGRGLYGVPRFISGGSSFFVLLVVYGILIARVGAWLLAVVMITIILNYVLIAFARKKHAQYYGQNSQYAARTDYISTQVADSSAGKDIRLYRLLDLFLRKYEESLKEMDRLFGKIHFWYHIRGIACGLLTLTRNAIIYGVLISFLTKGTLSVSELIYYIGLLSTFAGYFNGFVYIIMGQNSANVSIGYIRDFLSWENKWGQKEPQSIKKKTNTTKTDTTKTDTATPALQEESVHIEQPVKLELRHVSFCYPKSTANVLQDVNLVLQPGEKLALLGLNGAGKTTLTKLICGFYQPTGGEILINDKPIREYQREEYYNLLSVLFQDHTILPVTLDENLTASEEDKINRTKLERALKLAGFTERYERLPEKGKTKLVREVVEGSVDFSGGEYQKLLFARALYREAPLTVLDEPTAALDPIAENEMYQNFNEAMKNSTVIYISHRLASTQFCDRIVLLENGCIVEEGTHETLLHAGGRYANLYELQSRYYS